MKKRTFVLGACLIAGTLVFTGCPGDGNGIPANERLIVGTIGNPVSLDPVMANDSASAQIFQQIYNRLFELDFNTLAAVPSLAERHQFEAGPDGQLTRLRVWIRQGVRFHNGDEMRASDVAFSISRAMVSPQVSFIYTPITSVEAVGNFEVLFVFSEPWIPALNHLAHASSSIISERAYREMGGDAFAQNPVGSGPMKFVNWVVGDHLELARNDDFWGTNSRLQQIIFRTIPDAATRLMSLETGEIDVMYMVLPADIPRLNANPEVNVIRVAATNINYIGFNTAHPPLNDIRVREAIIYATDLNAMVEHIFMGVGAPGRAPITSTVWASAADYLPQRPFNPARARELLAEAGHAPGTLNLSIHVNEGNATRLDMATAMQGWLAEVGINLSIHVIEWAAYLDMTGRIDGGHQLFILGWVAVTGDPDYALDIFHTRSFGAAGNRFFWSNPEMDALLDAARGESNPQIRYNLYIEAQRLIHAGAPLIVAQEGETVIAARANVRNLIPNPAGEENLWAAWID